MVTSGPPIPKRGLFIDGRWESTSGRRLDVINPFDGSVIGSIAGANSQDVDRAVEAANRAFKTWRKTTGAQRAGYLRKIADGVKARRADLAYWETLDNGKPIAEAEADIDDVAACFNYYATLAEKLDERQDQRVDVGEEDYLSSVRREPLGVVSAITPWNYPQLMAAWKVCPALAAGNTVVLKPSELASVTCLELAAIAHKAGLPPGVFNVVTGLGRDAGAPLSAHPGVAKVAFTGSVETGRAVNLAAAQNLRPTTMELGGKSPMIIFEDCDIDKTVEWIAFGIFANSGQICSATSRLLIQKSIAPQLLEKLKARAESINVTNPLDPDCRLGPVVSEGQHNKILKFIETAKKEGAQLLTGGSKPPHLQKGFFIQPTVFTDVTPNMTIWNQEIFGPVLATTTFADEAEAVRVANQSEFGLGAAVVSADKQRCERVARALEAGIVWINCSQPTFLQAPWGGTKNSGFGRELGQWGLDAFTSVKQITSYISDAKLDWYPDIGDGSVKSKM